MERSARLEIAVDVEVGMDGRAHGPAEIGGKIGSGGREVHSGVVAKIGDPALEVERRGSREADVAREERNVPAGGRGRHADMERSHGGPYRHPADTLSRE